MVRAAVLVFALSACGKQKTAPAPSPPAVASSPAAPVVLDGPILPVPALEKDAPPVAPHHAYDPKASAETVGHLIGVSDTEVGVTLYDKDARDTPLVVIDRTTGCVTDGYPPSKTLDTLQNSPSDVTSEGELAKAEVRQALRDEVGVRRRFASSGADALAWSESGRYVFVLSNRRLYRSVDGGRSYARVDDERSGRLHMSRDGKHLVYERNSTYVSLPVDGSGPPVALIASTARPFGFASDGTASFSRNAATEVCADTFDLARGALMRSVCLPLPGTRKRPPPSGTWRSLSPNGRWGLVEWDELRRDRFGSESATFVISVVEMETKKIRGEATDVRAVVDDNGNMIADTSAPDGFHHTFLHPLEGRRRLLADAYLLSVDADTALLAPYRPGATLAARRCDLVKLVKITK